MINGGFNKRSDKEKSKCGSSAFMLKAGNVSKDD